MSESEIIEKLKVNLNRLKISANYDKFLQYLYLLNKWNNTYNLTAIRDINIMVSRHIIDSLTIIPWIKKSRLLDVGTGAGLPGIPLALALPDCKIILLDSNGKKIRFLEEVKRILTIANIEVIQTRVECYHPQVGFDTVITRAFSDLQKMTKLTNHLLEDKGIWLAMKGQYPEDELQNIIYPWQAHEYNVPEIAGKRTCVIINKQ